MSIFPFALSLKTSESLCEDEDPSSVHKGDKCMISICPLHKHTCAVLYKCLLKIKD